MVKPQQRPRGMDPGGFALPPPSPQARMHSLALQAQIAEAIAAAGGWLPFDRFMHLALYAPGLGYYAAGSQKFGASDEGGDFVTAPELSPFFARTLAGVLLPILQGTAAQVLEFGAGTGTLAFELCGALAAAGAPLTEYVIVEVSPDLQARQKAHLAGLPVRWLSAPPVGFVGAILANEVLDVMPVRLFVWHGDNHDRRLHERGVVLQPARHAQGEQVAGFAFAFAFADRPADAALIEAVGGIEADTGPLPSGYVSEVGVQAQAWMALLADTLAHGVALLIDYGFPRHEYYHRQRAMGTLMCHYRHRAHADPLWWPGLNDITAHVDFTAMAEAAQRAGLDVLGYTSQSRFLLNGGLLDALVDATRVERAAALRLVSEAEMGELFKVLLVGRGALPLMATLMQGDRLHTL